MSDFDLNSIGRLLSGDGITAISNRTKINPEEIRKILNAGIPTMIAGMRKNASTEEGAESLARALTDHSADDTSNVYAFLKGADIKDGKKILGHVLGDNQKTAVNRISDATGVTKGKTTSILAMVAPLLLSQLGGQQQQAQSSGGFNLLGMLGGLLGGGAQQSAAPAGGGLFGNMFGGLFGGAQQQAVAAQQQAQQQVQQQAGVLDLLGGSEEQSSSEGGLLEGLLGLFH